MITTKRSGTFSTKGVNKDDRSDFECREGDDRRMMVGTDQGIVYDRNGRMLYNQDFHDRQGHPFTLEELAYLCKYYEFDPLRTIAFALGRTESTLKRQESYLKKRGLYDHYKML